MLERYFSTRGVAGLPAATTLITPAENRFFLLSERARRRTTLQQISALLRAHVTVKADSDFLKPTVRNLILQEHAQWLSACSHEWQLLASLPYVVNPSEARREWHHCELCHKPVRYEYHVQNKHNHRELIVGSECVKKFMNAETRYLMVITTEDNFYAVAQYQTLTTAIPVVPTIMFAQPWLPQLPSEQVPQARQLRQTTTQTVTTYLRHKTKQLPLQELKPAEQTYRRLAQAEQDAITTAEEAARAQLLKNQQQRQQQAAQTAEQAEQDLRQSSAYRHYLQQLAAIIVTRPDRATAKQRFEQLSAPTTERPLVNSYQFGQMVTEYRQTGQIQVRRLAMLDHQFVTELNQVTQQLDERQTTRFYDDVFNSCWGWRYHQQATQRADWEKLLTTRWGQPLSLTWFEQLSAQTDSQRVQAWLSQHADATMKRELTQRLVQQSERQPIARTRMTRTELRQFCRREQPSAATLAAFEAAFDRYYQLPAAQQATTHETLAYYYVAHQYQGDHQRALQQLTWLLKS